MSQDSCVCKVKKSERTFEDSLNMTVNNLQNVPTTRGISTSRYGIPELMSQAFQQRNKIRY